MVGLSGGVDSAVSAWLLKQQNYHVQGVFMKNWEEDDTQRFCPAEKDLTDVRNICQQLKIPLHTVNFAQEYWQQVFSLFLEEYQAGRTPNPDVLCNQHIKFKAFLDYARRLGADYIATGHYARLIQKETHLLLKGLDLNKDQSYFLHTLNQAQLHHSLFPIGHLTKPHVRQLAKEAGLTVFNKKDSTGICFIGEKKFKSFLQDYLPTQPGTIQTPEGKVIGQHDGLMFYTLGQRQGLKIGGIKGSTEQPWYVVAKDLNHNCLIVTQDTEHPWHFCKTLQASKINWIKPDLPSQFNCQAKVRYRQADQDCQVKNFGSYVQVTFAQQQRAVTPGQSIVFYDQEICLGGGMIQSTDSPGGLFTSIKDLT